MAPTLPGFEEFYNSAASTRTGVSPGGMALGHSAASSRAIAHRHKTLVLSISDRKEPDPPRVEAGNLGRWRRNPKNGTQAAFVVVPVLDVVGSSSLIREPAGLPVWVPNRNIFPTTIPVPVEPAPIADPAPVPAVVDVVPLPAPPSVRRQIVLPDPPGPPVPTRLLPADPNLPVHATTNLTALPSKTSLLTLYARPSVNLILSPGSISSQRH